MPVDRTSEVCDLKIELSHWSAPQLDQLVSLLAWLVVGHVLHVEQILTGSVSDDPAITERMVDIAKEKLHCADRNTVDKYGHAVPHPCVVHRDGWLFQLISWIVSSKEFPGTIIKTPQPRKTESGFDGLLLKLDGSTILYVLMVEDKATDDPRNTVRNKVWPEFKSYETGERDPELVAEASVLLRHWPGIDANQVVKAVDWLSKKRYRASVATTKDNLPAQVHVFEGYEDTVPGDPQRRLANLLLCANMRDFFEDLSHRISDELERMRP